VDLVRESREGLVHRLGVASVRTVVVERSSVLKRPSSGREIAFLSEAKVLAKSRPSILLVSAVWGFGLLVAKIGLIKRLLGESH